MTTEKKFYNVLSPIKSGGKIYGEGAVIQADADVGDALCEGGYAAETTADAVADAKAAKVVAKQSAPKAKAK